MGEVFADIIEMLVLLGFVIALGAVVVFVFAWLPFRILEWWQDPCRGGKQRANLPIADLDPTLVTTEIFFPPPIDKEEINQ